MKKSVTIVIAVLVLIVGVFAFTTQSAKSPEPVANIEVSAANTINYGDNGFEPSSLTVKSGTTILVKNNSAKALQFRSNEHPSHTENQELNMGALNPGKSDTFTANKIGNYGYHNHLNPNDNGTLVIQ